MVHTGFPRRLRIPTGGEGTSYPPYIGNVRCTEPFTAFTPTGPRLFVVAEPWDIDGDRHYSHVNDAETGLSFFKIQKVLTPFDSRDMASHIARRFAGHPHPERFAGSLEDATASLMRDFGLDALDRLGLVPGKEESRG